MKWKQLETVPARTPKTDAYMATAEELGNVLILDYRNQGENHDCLLYQGDPGCLGEQGAEVPVLHRCGDRAAWVSGRNLEQREAAHSTGNQPKSLLAERRQIPVYQQEGKATLP